MSGDSSAPTRERRGVEIESAASHSMGLLGHTVEARLDAVLWQLVGGEISLSDLTPALRDWWVVASEYGRQSANQDRIERLEWLVDWYAFKLDNPGRDYYAAATDRLWREGVAA